MKIKQLKEYIKDLPDDMEVVTRGYEDGYDSSSGFCTMEVKESINRSWYNGKYTSIDDEYGTYGPIITVLHI